MNPSFKAARLFPVSGTGGESDAHAGDLRDVQDFLWRRWKLILAVTASAVILTFIALSAITPRYTANVEVLLDPRKEKIFGAEQMLPELALDNSSVDSQVSVARSINLLRKVVEKENLVDDEEFGTGATKNGALAFIQRLFSSPSPIQASGARKKGDIPPNVLDAMENLSKALEVQRQNRTYILSISVTSENPEKAAHLANAIADTFVSEQLEARYNAAKRASAWMAERIEALRLQVQRSEEAVTKFRRENNLVAASSEGKDSITEHQLSDLNQKLMTARAETAEKEAAYKAAPGYLRRISYEIAKAREEMLERQLKEISAKTGFDSGVGVHLRELERINAVNKKLFEDFLSRTRLAQEQSSFETNEARVISPATLPTKPSFPKKGLMSALAGALGLVLGIGGGTVLDKLRPGFSTPRELEERLGLPVLSTVPILSDSERIINGKSIEPASFVLHNPLSPYSEAIRGIRVGMRMAGAKDLPKVILVTSTVPEEGKSTLACSLAFSAAKAKQTVALIDGDLRNASVTKFFNVEEKEGLSDFLNGDAGVDQVKIVRDGVTVIPAGLAPESPPDLLVSERLKELVNQLRGSFDYVVIDSPPIGAVVDAKVLSAVVDKLIYVVRWQTTPRELVEQFIGNVADTGKIAGVVLNLVNPSKMPRYGYYGHYGQNHYYTRANKAERERAESAPTATTTTDTSVRNVV